MSRSLTFFFFNYQLKDIGIFKALYKCFQRVQILGAKLDVFINVSVECTFLYTCHHWMVSLLLILSLHEFDIHKVIFGLDCKAVFWTAFGIA